MGFVPLVDSAPLVVAQELGCFDRQGLQVELIREPGWATIRDKIAYRELDAAHALAGLCFAISWGLGVLRQPCLTAFLFNSHGDAITISKSLFDAGVTDPNTLAAEIRSLRRESPITFGVPHLFSSHHFLLRHWLRPAGLIPGRDLQIIVLPPSLMASSLASGYIDGFCVGEPFNSLAVREESGVVLAESADLSPGHPEKALLVTQEFADTRADEHMRLIRALTEAVILCDSPEGRETACQLLAKPEYLNLDEELLRQSLFAGDTAHENALANPQFHVFSGSDVNEPSSAKASWLVGQMRQAGMLDDLDDSTLDPIGDLFRSDHYKFAVPNTIPTEPTTI